MHPVHKCTQDCETIHKEIIKKIILVLVSSRSRIKNQSNKTNQTSSIEHDNNKNKNIGGNKNNWFGLETPLSLTENSILQSHEESIKTFLSDSNILKEKRTIKILVQLDNDTEEEIVGIEDFGSGRKGPMKNGKHLLEVWTIKFDPKNTTENTNTSTVNNSDEEVRKLYRRTSIYIRSLYSVLRLLPTYSIVQNNFQLSLEICFNSKDQEDKTKKEQDYEKRLRESLMSLSFLSLNEENERGESSTKSFESVNQTDLSLLQTNHGNLEISVAFRKTLSNNNFNLYKITKSPAIRVPQQERKRMIRTRDIQIKSGSSPGSGDWIDMAQHLPALVMNSNRRTSNQHPTGQIKILTAHKPSPSSLSSRTPQGKIMELTEFIKIFERPEVIIHQENTDDNDIDNTGSTGNIHNTNITFSTSSTNTPSLQQLIQVLEEEKSKKILFDRWLEELEIIHENIIVNSGEGFDLINNME